MGTFTSVRGGRVVQRAVCIDNSARIQYGCTMREQREAVYIEVLLAECIGVSRLLGGGGRNLTPIPGRAVPNS